MDYQHKYLAMKNKYIELKNQIGGNRDNILKLLHNMNNYSISTSPVLPISYEPPQMPNNIPWRVDRNGLLYGYAFTRDSNKLAADGGRQLLVTNITVYPLLSQVGYELLNKIINYGRQNNYSYLLLDAPDNISRFNNKFTIGDNNYDNNNYDSNNYDSNNYDSNNYIIYKL